MSRSRYLLAGLLIAATLAAYVPALSSGFIWDDDSYVTDNPTLKSLDGLRRIWFVPDALPQYYPLVHTTFWVEHHLWGLAPFGYHVVNVLLHALNALLLCAVLERLSVRGAWLAAFLFALHPVHVESVAWITERKNVLSGSFYLAAGLALLHFYRVVPGRRQPAGPAPGDAAKSASTASRNSERPASWDSERPVSRDSHRPASPNAAHAAWSWYALASLLYVCALLSKTVTASLPLALLIVLWWKRDRLHWRDTAPLAPLLLLGAGFGAMTAWIEKHHVGAKGEAWSLSLVERGLVAGRALWFYAVKLVWPIDLMFFYPRWRIDSGSWWQYVYPATAAGTILALWLLRRRLGKGPLAGVLFFIVTLAPALGFFDVFPMRYSYVADHFQYLASIGLIAVLAAVAVRVWKASPIALISSQDTARSRSIAPSAGAVAAAGAVPSNRASAESHRAGPPSSAVPSAAPPIRSETGGRRGRHRADLRGPHHDDPRLRSAGGWITRRPPGAALAAALPLFMLGVLTWRQCGIYKDAETLWRSTIARNPEAWMAHNNLGIILDQRGEIAGAISEYTLALRQNPDLIEAYNNLGNALAGQGKTAEAAAAFAEAVHREPEYVTAQYNLGGALFKLEKYEEAALHLSAALRLEPDFVQARDILAVALHRAGREDEALAEKVEVLRFKAWIRATHEDPALRSAQEAIGFAQSACEITKYGQPLPVDALAAAYAEAGRFPEAVAVARRAAELAQSAGAAELARAIDERLRLYEAGRPFRDPALSRIGVDASARRTSTASP